MKLNRNLVFALFPVVLVGLTACGEGETEDSSATDTSNNIGIYSQTLPQALSALPGSPVASGSTDVRSDYGIGTIDIDLYTSSADSANSTRTSGSANNIQLQPLPHLDALGHRHLGMYCHMPGFNSGKLQTRFLFPLLVTFGRRLEARGLFVD